MMNTQRIIKDAMAYAKADAAKTADVANGLEARRAHANLSRILRECVPTKPRIKPLDEEARDRLNKRHRKAYERFMTTDPRYVILQQVDEAAKKSPHGFAGWDLLDQLEDYVSQAYDEVNDKKLKTWQRFRSDSLRRDLENTYDTQWEREIYN